MKNEFKKLFNKKKRKFVFAFKNLLAFLKEEEMLKQTNKKVLTIIKMTFLKL